DGIRDKLVTGVQTCALPICFESSPVTRNAIGWPANVTSLPSPGIRMTAFVLIALLPGWCVVRHNMTEPHPKGLNSPRNCCKIFANGTHSANGDDPRVWPVPPRRGRRNALLRRRTDRA